MAVVFLLGPGMWDPAKRKVTDPDPLKVRREIAKVIRRQRHRVILMEDDPDKKDDEELERQAKLLAREL